MIIDTLDSMIAETMKNREMNKLESLRMIKATLVKAKKDGVDLTEATECKIIQKMMKQTEDAIEQFKKAGREDLVAKETADLEVIKEFAPKEASNADIIETTLDVCRKLASEGVAISMASMKDIMPLVQEKFPTASGKIISNVVRNWGK